MAAFIGSPAMNLVEAELADGILSFAGYRVPVQGPQGTFVVGIRPEAFQDAAFADPSLPQIDVTVEVVEELGAETHDIFPVDAAPVDVSGAREQDEEEVMIGEARTHFTARVDPQTSARPGMPLRLSVDPARFHYFDPDTGDRFAGTAAPALARA